MLRTLFLNPPSFAGDVQVIAIALGIIWLDVQLRGSPVDITG